MTPSSVTCPHCHTKFDITAMQLAAAKGSVRCGACLQMFDAAQQFEQAAQEAHHKAQASLSQLPAQSTQSMPVTEKLSSLPAVNINVVDAFLAQDKQRRKQLRWETHRAALLSIIAGVLMVVLGFQYLWFNRDILAMDRSLRPFYKYLCQSVGCKLPVLSNVKAIYSDDLMVRTHPDMLDALQVDAVMINGADFVQPFPNLVLTFSDLQGKVVATRSFAPSEYLYGELAGDTEMPINQPVRISLEIVDPGPQAINYWLTFAPTDESVVNRANN